MQNLAGRGRCSPMALVMGLRIAKMPANFLLGNGGWVMIGAFIGYVIRYVIRCAIVR